MIDLEKIERELSTSKLYICREGPERWAGGMAGPESTYVPIDYSPHVVLALMARIRELEARLPDEDDADILREFLDKAEGISLEVWATIKKVLPP